MVYNHYEKCMGAHKCPHIYLNMNVSTLILIAKYIIGTMIVISIICAPAWVARQTDKGKQDMHIVRTGSWLFGWSIIGWFYALFIGTKK